MIGSIIGDLAAWTWLHDKDVFYRQLVAEHAPLSEYGMTTLTMAKVIQEREPITLSTLRPQPVRLSVNMLNALAGWLSDSADEAQTMARKIVNNLQFHLCHP